MSVKYILADEVRQPGGHALRGTLEYILADAYENRKYPLYRRSSITMNYQFTEAKPLRNAFVAKIP